jgi:hypothetical protein
MKKSPSTDQRAREIMLMREALAAACDPRDTWYVSTPITTGRRLAEWRSSRSFVDEGEPGHRDSLNDNVIAPNSAAAKDVVDRLRSAGRVVINPAAVGALEGWTQTDYHVLWADVIERYVSTVAFMDGWHLSDGCTYELLVAVRKGCTLVRQDLAPLTLERALELVAEGARDSQLAGDVLEELAAMQRTAKAHGD